MNTVENRILKVHAIFLIVLTISNTILSLIGQFKSIGPYKWLVNYPLVEAGLFQAYLLMLLLAVVILFNANKPNAWFYSLIAILAHTVSLSVNFIFRDSFTILGFVMLSNFSIAIHSFWIFVEAAALFITLKKALN